MLLVTKVRGNKYEHKFQPVLRESQLVLMDCSLLMIFLSQLPAFGPQPLALDELTALQRLLNQFPQLCSPVTNSYKYIYMYISLIGFACVDEL